MSGWQSAFKKTIERQTEFVRPAITPRVIDWPRLVRVDFETYFDAEYTLRKLSTSEYVRDSRFKAQMLGIKIGRKPTKIYDGKKGELVLRNIDWSTHALLCHHTHFDGFIMSHHYGIVPSYYYDTLSMARGLHSNEVDGDLDSVAKFYGGRGKVEGFLEKTKGVRDWPAALFKEGAIYCGQDVDEMDRVFGLMAPKMPADEMDLIDLTVRMFCDPVLQVDIPRVEAEYARELERRERLFFTAVDPNAYDIGGANYDATFHKKSLVKGPAERALEGAERSMLIAKRLLGNNEFYADLLRAEGIEPPLKISDAWIKTPTAERDDDKKWIYAFAKDDLEFAALPDNVDEWRGDLNPNKKRDVAKIAAKQERIRGLVDARLAVKSTGNITRAGRFLEAGRDGMKLPVGYAYYRAHTGRYGGANKMNMQNLTRKGELRKSILAPKGYYIDACDSGQIEARVNAWLWGQNDLLEEFKVADAFEARWAHLPEKERPKPQLHERDVYCKFADLMYGRTITKEDDVERYVAKTARLGLGYQLGAQKLQLTLAGGTKGPPVFLTIDECHRIVNLYRRTHERIKAGWSKCNQIIEDMAVGRTGTHKCLAWEKGVLWLPNGMSLKYPELRQSTNEETGWVEWTYMAGDRRTKLYGGALDENIVQALARVIVFGQKLEISRKYRVVMSTHDEVVALAKIREAERCKAFMLKIMRTPPAWCADIPLNAEAEYGPAYS